MTAEELSTKEKILVVAHKLFAEKGLNGVSVREIAKEADANIAAINYHFGNKEALYTATISECMMKMSRELQSFYTDSITPIDLALSYYDHLLRNKNDLITSFKLFLDTDNSSICINEDDKMIGPPGGAILFKTIQNHVPTASQEDINWAVRVLFTQIIHTALLMANHGEEVCQNTGLSSEDMRAQLARTAKVFVGEITP